MWGALGEGYKYFFPHCLPFVTELGALWREQNRDGQMPPARGGSTRAAKKIGHNDPCPCGSGRKYKKCCMGK
ncbi:SEC-C metal-binding domain-containing protein [Thermodesulfobacteriota bacterium]